MDVGPRTGPPPSGAVVLNRVPIPGGSTFIGTDNPITQADGEGPKRKVRIRSFSIGATTVTNGEFTQFIAATGYVTDAERIGWSPVFAPPAQLVALNRSSEWKDALVGEN